MALVVLKVGRTVGFAFCSLYSVCTVHTQSQLEKACAATKHTRITGVTQPPPKSYWFVLKGTHWYSLVLTGTGWYSLVLTGTGWYSLVLDGTHWYWMVLTGTQRYWMVLAGTH